MLMELLLQVELQLGAALFGLQGAAEALKIPMISEPSDKQALARACHGCQSLRHVALSEADPNSVTASSVECVMHGMHFTSYSEEHLTWGASI